MDNKKLTQYAQEYERGLAFMKSNFESSIKLNKKLKGIAEIFDAGDTFYSYVPEANKNAVDVDVDILTAQLTALDEKINQANLLINEELDKQTKFIEEMEKQNASNN